MARIMFFAPHPDDDVIGCGGSIAKYVKNVNQVSIVYLTSGDAGSLKYSKPELANLREEEARKAALLLGVTDLTFLGCPDGYIEYNKENLIKIISIIRSKQPHKIYIPHNKDAVQDHMITHKLIIEASNRAAGPWFQECEGKPWSVDTILGYEVWTPLQNINYSEDITSFIDIKIEALKQHKSQIEDIRYDEAIKGLNRYRGAMTGIADYCECFQIIKGQKI